jgi:hypothetical protein
MRTRRIFQAAVVAIGSVPVLVMAAPAIAAVTTSNITTPADGTQLFQNLLTNPNQMITVRGTSDGTTGDSVDIDCYQVIDQMPISVGGYTAGIAVQIGGGFSASIPEASFPRNTCHLVAVPHGTTPSPGNSYTGPRVAFSRFSTTTISSGPNAGRTFFFTFGDATMTAQTYLSSLDGCGSATTLPMGDRAVTVSDYVFFCAAGFHNSNADFGGATDLTRSELDVDGQNAYGSVSAEELFTGSNALSGFPAARVTLNSFDPSTGNAKVMDTEALVKCAPSDVYNPTSAGCTSFASTGVSISRVTQTSHGGRVATQTDTFTSTDRAQHTLDLLYEMDIGSTAAGWELPGQRSLATTARGTRLAGHQVPRRRST